MPGTNINFFTESISYVLRDKTGVRKWLERCARIEKKKIGTLNYIFCSDRYLRNINRKFLNHDYNTDIITFPGSLPGEEFLSGEMYISIERVRDNAGQYGVTMRPELCRVMVHGLLHLCGYDDKTVKGREEMRKREDTCLALFR